MTDRPIIFSAPMILALLEGRKSQTRRLAWKEAWRGSDPLETDPPNGWRERVTPDADMIIRERPTIWQRVEVGDRLWVREKHWGVQRASQGGTPHLIYDEEWDGAFPNEDAPLRPCGLKFGPHPSIHMFRWSSRLTLTVTDVRVERLQEISGSDAISEGIKQYSFHGVFKTARKDFQSLWGSLHGPDAWDANQEVVRIVFTVHHGNIDQMEAT